jgi:hypothetical protein
MTDMGGRHIRTVGLVLGLAAALAAAAACGAAPPAGGSSGDAAAGTPAAAPSAGPNKLDMNAIFPEGPGRDLVLNNCQNCHTIVPIVVLQMEEDAWNRSGLDHRERVIGLPDDDFKTLYDYLKANFNPSRPVPKLPQELLDTWTGY